VKLLVIGEAPSMGADTLAWSLARIGSRASWSLEEKERFAERMLDRIAVTGTCGECIAELAGIPLKDFLRRTDRFNVLRRWPGGDGKGDIFPKADASMGVLRLAKILPGRRVLFLGRRAAGAFRVSDDYLTWAWRQVSLIGISTGFDAAILPHPSGVNRWWNEEANRDAARKVLKAEFITQVRIAR